MVRRFQRLTRTGPMVGSQTGMAGVKNPGVEVRHLLGGAMTIALERNS